MRSTEIHPGDIVVMKSREDADRDREVDGSRCVYAYVPDMEKLAGRILTVEEVKHVEAPLPFAEVMVKEDVNCWHLQPYMLDPICIQDESAPKELDNIDLDMDMLFGRGGS